ncbi:MAG: hypothetical protein DMG80_17250 [Acidobacteria bacterium]|nr:MAG: hypothetical protein DMG80_17250 [Acidobacteriota bacterium]
MFARMMVSIVLALLVCVTALAQDAAKPSDDESKTKAVTGCLQKGDQADQFSITGDDGKSWDLRSSTVKLDEHVGHKVTVTGSPTREAKAEEKKEGQVENAARKEVLGELRVTDLRMVSPNCTK